MEVVANNYLPGDQRLVDKIVYELKAQGIFDQFRKECFADVDTKPAYQNLRQRVEGSVAGFLKDQSWRPDMNKNQVREMLRKTMTESGYLETGVERIVDQVVNPKINTVFLPQVEEVVYSYLGIKKPNRNEPVKAELCDDLLPNDLEAVSPESEPVDKKDDKSSDTFHDLEDTKTEEDESPPFEPLEEQTVYVPHEENSVDSHMSGFSGLVSHESNQSNEIKITPMEQDSQMSRNSSDSRLSIVTSDENSKMEVCEDSQSKSIKSNDSNSKLDDRNKHRSSDKHKSRSDDKSDKDRKSSKDSRSRHSSSSFKDKDKSRDRKDSKGPSTSNSKNEKDKEREKDKPRDKNEKDRKTVGNSNNKYGSHSSNSSSSSTSKDKSVKKDSTRSDKDREKNRSSGNHKDSKIRDKSVDSKSKEKSSSSDKHKHSSSSSSHNDRHKKDKDGKDKKKESKSKDDHYSSKDKRNDRRSRDRDSSDGQSSKQNFSSLDHSSQNQKSGQESTSGSGDSNTSNHTENTTKAPVIVTGVVEGSEITISPPEQRVKVFKPKCASNMQEALRLRKIRKQLAKLEKKNQLSLTSVNVSSPILLSASINLDDLKHDIVDERAKQENANNKIVAQLEVVPSPLQNTVISQDNWDAMEAKLREAVCSEFKEYNDDSLDDSMEDKSKVVKTEPDEVLQKPAIREDKATKMEETREEQEESCKYFDSVDVKQIEFLVFIERFINAVEKRKMSGKEKTHKRKVVDNDLKNNNNKPVHVIPDKKARIMRKNKEKMYNHAEFLVNEKFSLPLSPAESDKSIGRKDDIVTPLKIKAKRNIISKANNQRYSSDDLYKPRPTFASSRRRGAKNLEN